MNTSKVTNPRSKTLDVGLSLRRAESRPSLVSSFNSIIILLKSSSETVDIGCFGAYNVRSSAHVVLSPSLSTLWQHSSLAHKMRHFGKASSLSQNKVCSRGSSKGHVHTSTQADSEPSLKRKAVNDGDDAAECEAAKRCRKSEKKCQKRER